MSYPLIIFGAGASFDYSQEGKLAPLTNELVTKLQHGLISKFRGSGAILADIKDDVINDRKSFEEALTLLKQETLHSSEMKKKFTALEFYLSYYFRGISNGSSDFHSTNNYSLLKNRLDTY